LHWRRKHAERALGLERRSDDFRARKSASQGRENYLATAK